MRSRVQVVFWPATLVAVILLGVTWTLAERVAAGGARVEEDVLLAWRAPGWPPRRWWPRGS